MEKEDFLTKHIKNVPKCTQSRDNLLSRIAKNVHDAIYEAALESDRACASIDLHDGCVEIEVSRFGDEMVCVSHFENEHRSTMLEEAIRKCLPDWDEVESKAEEDLRKEREYQDYLWKYCRFL